MSDIQHGKRITTESYYEGKLASTKTEQEVSTFSNKQDILKDVIDALSVVSKGDTSKLTLEICVDKQQRYRLIRKWLV